MIREGRPEPSLQEALTGHLRPDMVFYDLGANLGFFSLLAARLVGPKGTVVSFEADPEVAQRLQGNVEKNGFMNVQLVQKAAWSTSGIVAFSRSDQSTSPDRAWGRIVKSPVSTQPVLKISCTSLDDFVQTHPRPDFIKCDVEGAEVEVFRGAMKVLSTYRPVVECEIHSHKNKELLEPMFRALNYDIRWLVVNHFIAVPRD